MSRLRPWRIVAWSLLALGSASLLLGMAGLRAQDLGMSRSVQRWATRISLLIGGLILLWSREREEEEMLVRSLNRHAQRSSISHRSIPITDLPGVDNDRTGLQHLTELGADLSIPISLEFFVDVPDQAAGHEVSAAIRAAGLSDDVHVVFDEGEQTESDDETGGRTLEKRLLRASEQFDPSWTVLVVTELLPTAATLQEFQERLSRAVAPRGTPGGWGYVVPE